MKNLSSVAATKKAPSLIFCVVMDLIGYTTYAIPFLGEFGDILWAPVSAIIFFKTFGGWKGAFGGIFNFVEEILPGLDFIPTFTLTWLWQTFRKPGNTIERTTNPVYHTTGKQMRLKNI
jgi:hypothetical protein